MTHLTVRLLKVGTCNGAKAMLQRPALATGRLISQRAIQFFGPLFLNKENTKFQAPGAPLLSQGANWHKGGLAQLVERLLCKQNVNGSNPLTSTTK